MTATLTAPPLMQFFASDGSFLSGGKLYTYAAGTTTPLATYTSQSGLVANTNPVVMNSRGEAAVWLGAELYKLVLKTSADVLIWTADNVGSMATQADLQAFIDSLASATGSSLVGFSQAGTGASTRTVQTKLREGWISVTDYGATGDGTTADDTAFANWTKAIAGTGKIGFIPKPTSFYKLTAPWDCTSANGTNNGLIIYGAGAGTVVKFIFSGVDVNVTPGWDLTGCAYGVFQDFTVIGGTSTADCPRAATLLMGATSGGSLFGGLHTFERVIFANYGDYVICNQGSELIDYFNCEAYGYSAAGTAVPFLYTAGGSAIIMSSPFVANASGTVNSMSAVYWHGARATQQSFGARMVLFHYTAAGGVIDINHDGYFRVAAANPFVIMGDDTGGIIASSAVTGCGIRDAIVEATSSTANLVVLKNQTSTSGDWAFDGRISIGVSLTAAQFQFQNDPFSGSINWIPNSYGGAWAGVALVTAPSGGGLKINTSIPAPTGNIDAIYQPGSDNFAVSGFHNYTHQSTGTDYNEIGSPTFRGPVANAQFNVFARIRAGARVGSESDGFWGVTTTQNVTGASAIEISSIPGYGGLVLATGVDTGAIFMDVLLATPTNVYVLQSGTAGGSPAGRTYSVVTNTLKLIMATGTYDTQVTFLNVGVQA